MKVTLTVHGQEHDGQAFVFTEPGSMLFGRAEKAQCRIANDPYVSRAHFLLLINPPDVRLRNLSRTNGTEVDGKSYKQSGCVATGPEAPTVVKGDPLGGPAEAVLRHGSQIEVGYTRVSVAIEQERWAYCNDCGAAIPASQRAAAALGTLSLCPGCREKRQRAGPPGPSDSDEEPGGASGRPDRPHDLLEELILRQLGVPEFRGIVRHIPGYEIVREIKRGAMGVILEAIRIEDRKKVALKLIRTDRPVPPDFRSRFKRETRILLELKHPHVITYIDGNNARGILWLAMEYVEGGYDIAAHMKHYRGRIPLPEAVELASQSLEGLAFAHRVKHVVHRDIKPANILLPGNDRWRTAKVSDFGLAKSLEDSGLNGSIMTKPAVCMGTLPYMPPEQAIDVRTATPTADVFSMGATLYEMVTGRYVRDFSRVQNEAIRQVVQDPVVPVQERDPSIPGALAAVIDKSLSLDPSERFADAEAFKGALQGAVR